jgi:DNA-directed RNA polymerase
MFTIHTLEKAEKKLLFIAFCFEYNRFIECFDNEKEYFETCLPIQLDATCNGYQHLALLSLDHDLAKELNLTKSTSDDIPKDFYNFTAVKLINYYNDQLSNNNLSVEDREVYTRFSNLTIARKIVKKVIMTIPYNVTHFTIIEYLKSNFTMVDSECYVS